VKISQFQQQNRPKIQQWFSKTVYYSRYAAVQICEIIIDLYVQGEEERPV
jgi:hypothetical protein